MKIVEQAIENCHMTHKYENPGIENGMCAGLRTMNGEGEPPEECKECRLYYGYADEHDFKKTKYDQIRSMCVDEMASFLSEVKYDGIYYNEGMEYPIISEVWKVWLQSEVEK